jgi:hypothetical protein
MAANGYNLFAGVIQRRIYFGMPSITWLNCLDSIDLRVVSSPSQRYDIGQKVFALAHPDHCVIVSEG